MRRFVLGIAVGMVLMYAFGPRNAEESAREASVTLQRPVADTAIAISRSASESIGSNVAPMSITKTGLGRVDDSTPATPGPAGRPTAFKPQQATVQTNASSHGGPSNSAEQPSSPSSDRFAASVTHGQFFLSDPWRRSSKVVEKASLQDGRIYLRVQGQNAPDGEYAVQTTVFDGAGREAMQLKAPLLIQGGKWSFGVNYAMGAQDAPGTWWFLTQIDETPVLSSSIEVAKNKDGS